MIVQEPVQAAIWHALNHYAYPDATFLAERLYAEVPTDDSLFLLATCYYRAGKTASAYSVLHKKSERNAQCQFLLARCCVDLKKYYEAESAITENSLIKTKSIDDISQDFGDCASFTVQLLGKICVNTERTTKATEAFRKSLKLNPFLWSSYESLVNLGEKPDPSKIFTLNSLENFSFCQGSNPVVNLVNRGNVFPNSPDGENIAETPQIPITQNMIKTVQSSNMSIFSPMALLRSGSDSSLEILTPDNSSWVQINSCQPRASATRVMTKTGNLFGSSNPNSPLTPSFGILPLDTPSPASALPHIPSNPNSPYSIMTPSPPALVETQVIDPRAPSKKQPMTRRGQTLIQPPKFQIFSQSGNNNNSNNIAMGQTQSPQVALQSGLTNVRRSSRLFTSSNSVKENNKIASKTGHFVSSKNISKKTKSKSSKGIIQPNESELNEFNKADLQSEKPRLSSTSIVTVTQTALNMQKASAAGLMQLLQDFGYAKLYMSHYLCRKAIDVLSALPPQHYNTGWVLCTLGRAYFELAEYEQTLKMFEKARNLEPHRLEGMEYYSTALWHLQQEVALSALAQELMDFDKNAPETLCTAGNCFSLQKEHETAIKFLQRAIQVQPDFPYAYTLLGHEHVLTEEMDPAMACFRNAIRMDPRHYNAWYGVGMIYYKQEKFQLAEVHFKKALTINPQSSVLMCHIGVVQHALQKTEASLNTMNKAIALDPKNPLCKFHRASIYFAIDRHREALTELEELKEIVPKESLVYFLIGKIHKKLGNTHLALMNFSWAMDLDPKGANNQIKEAIDKRYTNDEEEFALPPAGDDAVSVSSGPLDQESLNDSLMVEADGHQAMEESDESF